MLVTGKSEQLLPRKASGFDNTWHMNRKKCVYKNIMHS